MLSDADIAYVRVNYRPLADVCAEHGDRVEVIERLIGERRLPAPSYVLPDGTGMVPADYFALVPGPDDAGWQERLARDVEELDGLEREFSPDCDRRRFGRPPTRDALIVAARERFADLFAVGSHGR